MSFAMTLCDGGARYQLKLNKLARPKFRSQPTSIVSRWACWGDTSSQQPPLAARVLIFRAGSRFASPGPVTPEVLPSPVVQAIDTLFGPNRAEPDGWAVKDAANHIGKLASANITAGPSAGSVENGLGIDDPIGDSLAPALD
jgi:hypothetical protein